MRETIMAEQPVQRFMLIRPSVTLPPEWGCAGCQATMSEDPEPSGDYPAESVIIRHAPDCPEVSRMITPPA